MPPARSVLCQLRSRHSNEGRANQSSTSDTERANDPSAFNVGALSVEPFGRTTFCGGVEFN
jgi:hypothetical protein